MVWGVDKLWSESVFDNVDNYSSISCVFRSFLVINLNLELLEKKKNDLDDNFFFELCFL